MLCMYVYIYIRTIISCYTYNIISYYTIISYYIIVCGIILYDIA